MLNNLAVYGEEFTLGKGDSACLLVHGLGCGPIQMRGYAESLCKWGYTARGVLLPGHLMQINGESLKSCHDWKEKVLREYHQLAETHERVVIIGFSLGALLALQLVTQYPVEKIILMGTPLYIIRKYLPIRSLIKCCRYFIQRVKTRRRKCFMESERYSGYLLQPIETHHSLKALDGITSIIEEITPNLQAIQTPVLVIHSKRDTIAAPAGAKVVMKRIGSKHKQLVWLERSHHLMMYDRENDTVLNAMKDFLLGSFQKTAGTEKSCSFTQTPWLI